MIVMNKLAFLPAFLLLLWGGFSNVAADDQKCFESRKGASEVTQRMIGDNLPNVKCSPKTGAVLWWGDPYDGTVPMGEMPVSDADYLRGKAVVKPRSKKLGLLPLCGDTCHTGVMPAGFPLDRNPRQLVVMHQNIVLDSTRLPHGRGSIWCLDCHHPTKRNMLIDHRDNPISFDQPQKLCGKCHGDVYRDWRDGIHGKRIGEWASTGTKRWFVCTECHNPHNVQHGDRSRGIAPLEPERAPPLPKGLKTADHERRQH
jgi:hypothetical protein